MIICYYHIYINGFVGFAISSFCFWFYKYRCSFFGRFCYLPSVRKIYLAIKHGSALERIPGAKTRLNFCRVSDLGSETLNNFNSLDHKNRTNSKSNRIKQASMQTYKSAAATAAEAVVAPTMYTKYQTLGRTKLENQFSPTTGVIALTQ